MFWTLVKGAELYWHAVSWPAVSAWCSIAQRLGPFFAMLAVFVASPRSSHRTSTCAGKLLGLHSGDGHVMWSLAFPEGQTPQQMFLWRSSHDLQKAPQLLTLHSSETTSLYSVVDAHTGREVSSGTVDFPVSQVMCGTSPCISQRTVVYFAVFLSRFDRSYKAALLSDA